MKVTITAKETIRHYRVVDMTSEDFAEYEEAVERDESDEWFREFGERFIDQAQVDEGDGLEDVEVTPVK